MATLPPMVGSAITVHVFDCNSLFSGDFQSCLWDVDTGLLLIHSNGSWATNSPRQLGKTALMWVKPYKGIYQLDCSMHSLPMNTIICSLWVSWTHSKSNTLGARAHRFREASQVLNVSFYIACSHGLIHLTPQHWTSASNLKSWLSSRGQISIVQFEIIVFVMMQVCLGIYNMEKPIPQHLKEEIWTLGYPSRIIFLLTSGKSFLSKDYRLLSQKWRRSLL